MARKSNSRAPQGAGSIRQRPDGRWEARITIGTDPGTGKPVRKSFYGQTQAEVRKKLTAAQKAVDDGTFREPDKTSVETWMAQWLELFCAPKVKPLTLAAYRTSIRTHVLPAIGAMRLQAVRGTHIQALYNAMSEKGLSPKTIKNTSAILHKSFSVALKQGLIQSNPVDVAELPKAQRKEIRPLSDNEIPLFLDAIEDSPMRNAFALSLFAGLREGECLGLSWRQVDFESGTLTIDQQLQHEKRKGGAYYIAQSTKSGRIRTIQAPVIAFEYLRAERARQAQNRLAAGPSWSNPDDLVFTNELGRHICTATFYKSFKRIVATIGRPDARPHDLRHTAATVAIASGATTKAVQDLLGHSTPSFTLSQYVHTSDAMRKDTADRMQSYFENVRKKA